jgi:hypothetical protein
VSSAFQANAIKDFEIKQDSIDFAKEFDTEIGNFTLGFSYSSINLSTDPFSEILNSTSSGYALKDLDFDFYTPHFEYSKGLSFGLSSMKIGFGFKKPIHKKNFLKMNISLDVSNEVFTLDEELGLSEDPLTTFFISNVYRESLFTKLSYSQKEDNEMIQLRIGYLL